MTVKENLTTPITYDCDVLVCGGGIAGIASSLAAARKGKNVILVERAFEVGGLATAGLVTIYLALCDGYGHQVSFGIAEELLRLSVKYGYERPCGLNWWRDNDISKHTENDSRFEASFNPNYAAILYEQLLASEGVKILYGTVAVKAETENGKITSVIIENKSGRQAIKAKAVVDATGDADIAKLAGVKTKTPARGNVLASWYYSYSKDNGYLLRPMGCCDIPEEELKKGKPDVPRLSEIRFSGLDGEEISEFMIMSRKALLNDCMEYYKNDSTYVPITIPSIPELRMTRKIAGEYELDDTEKFKHFDDSIGMVSDWRKRGPVYEVPFGTLISRECKNLICAGRCTSVTDAMWDIMRVIPCCAVTGQAAGVAASMCDDFSTLDVSALQEALRSDGVVIHWCDIQK